VQREKLIFSCFSCFMFAFCAAIRPLKGSRRVRPIVFSSTPTTSTVICHKTIILKLCLHFLGYRLLRELPNIRCFVYIWQVTWWHIAEVAASQHFINASNYRKNTQIFIPRGKAAILAICSLEAVHAISYNLE